MTDPKLDKRLAEYLDREEDEQRKGFTIASLYKGLMTVSDAQNAHELKCDKRWDIAKTRHESVTMRLETLEAARKTPSVPPPRDRETSSHDWKEFAEVVKKAALDGEHRRDTTPDETVEKVVEATLAKREAQRALERVQAEDAEAQEEKRMAKEAVRESHKTRSHLIRAVLVTAIGSPLIERLIVLVFNGHW